MNITTRQALARFATAAAASLTAASIWAAGLPAEAMQAPQLGHEYEFTFAGSRVSLQVENGAKGMYYRIGYGGQTYNYVLGPYDAAATSIRDIADVDGDARPDFLIDVDAATYLLLSTHAQPGDNPPTAELVADGC